MNSPERVFGVKSVRSDKQVPKLISVANNINYGVEKGAGDLLRPGKYAADGLPDEEFTKAITPNQARDLMSSIGFEVSDAENDKILAALTEKNLVLNLDNYRHTMNKVKKLIV